MKYKYQVVITESLDNAGYDVFIPLFNQVTDGDTYEEALKSADDVLDLVICEYIDTGRELPAYEVVKNGVDIEVDVDPDSYVKVYWYSSYPMDQEMINAIGEKVSFINNDMDCDPESVEDMTWAITDVIAIDTFTVSLSTYEFLFEMSLDKCIPIITPLFYVTDDNQIEFFKWEQIDDVVIEKHDFEKIVK